MSILKNLFGKKELPTVYIQLLIDRSRSMAIIRQATIDGINNLIKSQNDGKAKTFVSLRQFDTYGAGFCMERKLHLCPVEDTVPLTQDDFVPRGGTPLNEAVIKAIRDAEAELRPLPLNKKEKVLFVIQTDGGENSSDLEYTSARVKAEIEAKTAQGWEFVYLGANQDAFEVGTGLGIPWGNIASYAGNPTGTKNVYMNTTASTRNFRAGNMAPGTFYGTQEKTKT